MKISAQYHTALKQKYLMTDKYNLDVSSHIEHIQKSCYLDILC